MTYAAMGGAAVGVVGNYLLNGQGGGQQQVTQNHDPWAPTVPYWNNIYGRVFGTPTGGMTQQPGLPGAPAGPNQYFTGTPTGGGGLPPAPGAGLSSASGIDWSQVGPGGGFQTPLSPGLGNSEEYSPQIGTNAMQQTAQINPAGMGGPLSGGFIDQGPNANMQGAWDQIAAKANGPNPLMTGANTGLQNFIGGGAGMGTGAGQSALPQAQYGNVAMDTSQIQGTLNGDFNNPYLKQMSDLAARDAQRQFSQVALPAADSTAMSSGRYGSNAWSNQRTNANQDLMQGLGDINTKMYGGAYEAERQRQAAAQNLAFQTGNQTNQFNASNNLQNSQFNTGNQIQNSQFNTAQQLNAIGMAPAMDQAGYFGANQLYNAGMQQNQFPWQQAQNAANLLSQPNGGQMTQNTPMYNNSNPITATIGGAAAGYGMFGGNRGGLPPVQMPPPNNQNPNYANDASGWEGLY